VKEAEVVPRSDRADHWSFVTNFTPQFPVTVLFHSLDPWIAGPAAIGRFIHARS
jgi:hypothetical protein